MEVEIDESEGRIPDNGTLFPYKGRTLMRLTGGSESRFLTSGEKRECIAAVYLSEQKASGAPKAGSVRAVPFSEIRGVPELEQKEPLKLEEVK